MLIHAPQAPTLETGDTNLPLSRITARGTIRPTLATLALTQSFTNGETLADVTYHCPLHPDWAVRAVTMRCGDRTVTTVVEALEQARETFAQARDEGHTAILAEEAASDELRLQLANVPAGATVEVTTEVVAWPLIESGRGSFIIPLVNGPKYGGSEAQQPHIDPADPDWRRTSCWLDLQLQVTSPDIDFGAIENDRIAGEVDPVGQVTVTFDATPHALYHEDESGRYLVVGVPALRLAGAPGRSRKTILLDRSGSMGGQGLSVATAMARQIADRVGEDLRYVYTFDDVCERIWVADAPGAAGRKRGRSAVDAISHVSAHGGTRLAEALHRIGQDLSGQIDDLILITDALVSQSECGHLVKSARALTEVGVAVHVLLVGAAPGRFIGECIARAGGGLYLEQTGSRYDQGALNDAVTRFLQGGCLLEAVTVDGKATPCKCPVRGRPVMIALSPDGRPDCVTVALQGTPDLQVLVAEAPEARYLWARERVMETVRAAWTRGQSINHHRADIEQVGVEHQILTPFTAMVGVDATQTHDRSAIRQVVAQASLPEGMDVAAFVSGSVQVRANAQICYCLAPPSANDVGDWVVASRRPSADGQRDWHILRQARAMLRKMLEQMLRSSTGVVPEQLVGPWVGQFDRDAVEVAAYALWQAGCDELATRLATATGTEFPPTAPMDLPDGEIEYLAREIAGQLQAAK